MSSPRSISYDTIITADYKTSSGLTRTWRVSRQLKQKTHVVTPGYAKIIATGGNLPENSYSYKSIKETYDNTRISGSLADLDAGRNLDWWSYYQSGSFGIRNISDPSAAARAQAIQRFFANAKSHKSNVGVTIAELPKTIALIGDTATRLTRFYKALKRFDISSAFSAIGLHSPKHQRRLERQSRSASRKPAGRDEFAAKTALEVNYGWKPLLGEIYSAAEDLANRLKTKSDHIYIRGGATLEGTYDFLPGFGSGGAHRTLVGPVVNSVRHGVSCKAVVLSPTMRTLAGMGMVNPLEIGWELIPFSFVADWFLPIGAWLDSLDALTGLAFAGGSESKLRKIQWVECLNGINTQAYAARFSGQRRSYKEVSFDRTKLTAFPSTFGMFHLEGLREAMGASRTINAISLLTLAIRRS